VVGGTFGTLPDQTSSGLADAFVRKYDSSLTGVNEVWTRQFGTVASDTALAVDGDDSGNVYVAGCTSGALPDQTLSGAVDAYVRKYDSSGNEVWTRQFGGGGGTYTQTWGAAVDGAGNAYVTGFTSGTLPDQANSGNFDAFVRKYDSSGNEVWTRQFGSDNSGWGGAYARRVRVDSSGNVYVMGYTGGAILDQTYLGCNDIFVRKYDSEGNILWTRQFGTTGDEYGYGLAVDGSDRIYVVGTTFGALPDQTPSGGSDAFIRKYDSLGNEVWTWQFGSSADDWATGVTVDVIFNIYIVGATNGALPEQTSAGGTDGFIVTLYAPPPTRQLTISTNPPEGGSTNPATGIYFYDEGAVVDITAIPAGGWQFVNWNGDIADTNTASTTVTMNADKTVIANFTRIPYNLTVNITGSGSTSPATGTTSYANDAIVRITATPNSGWVFSHWSGDVNGTTNPIDVTMNADKVVTANFAPKGITLIGAVNQNPLAYQGKTVRISGAYRGWESGVNMLINSKKTDGYNKKVV
jgi:hypothetical protein